MVVKVTCSHESMEERGEGRGERGEGRGEGR